jgi:hypothetical protein
MTYAPPPEQPTLDDPALIAILNQQLETIERMNEERISYDFNTHSLNEDGSLVYVNDDTPRTQAYVTARRNYQNYNRWPIYIAVYQFVIKIKMLKIYGLLSASQFEKYKTKLNGMIGDAAWFDSPLSRLESDLIKKLKSAYQMNHVVQNDLNHTQTTNLINRMSLLMRGGGNAKSTKSKPKPSSRLKRNTTRKPNPNKLAVAAAIKDITLLKARADFAALKAVPCADINQAAKTGNAVMDHYFFKHRLATKTKRAISYYEWIKTNWKRNQSEHSFYKFNLAQGKTPEKARYAVFRLYYGAIHGFKPLVAKWLHCTHKPTAILDFSAGWGGRCLGAMALDIPYIGIDTNTDLRPVYERMVRELDPSHRDKVTMRFEDAATVDYSKFKYDMVFTSPPYFKTVRPIEDYAHMPRYADRADFNARFLFPVIRSTYAHMARGGTYALNIPDDMHDEIRAAGILPSRLHAKHRLFIQPRFAKGNPKNPDVQYKEQIYVWKKP